MTTAFFPVREKLLVENPSPLSILASHRDAPQADFKEVNPYGISVYMMIRFLPIVNAYGILSL